MNITSIGVDISKSVFQIHGVDAKGATVLVRRVSRGRFLETMHQLPANFGQTLVGMEACGGAHHWGRALQEIGYRVGLMSPSHVKPYVRRDKTDRGDAEAICEAVTRPRTRFVAVKTLDQQALLSLHRIRQRLVTQRTAISNQARGILAEFGLITPLGINRVRSLLTEVKDGKYPTVHEAVQSEMGLIRQELEDLDERIKKLDSRLRKEAQESRSSQKLLQIPGIGPLTATALVSAIGDPKQFRRGRDLSSWLGLVPREHSSGMKRQLGGISKRGNSYLRMLLIHGARSAVYAAQGKDDGLSRWIHQLVERRGTNIATVALANRMARTAWALLTRQEEYRKDHEEKKRNGKDA